LDIWHGLSKVSQVYYYEYFAPARLIFAHADDYRLILSAPIVREILEVLNRAEITRKIRFVAGMDTRRVLDLLSQAELVGLSDIPQVSRDPKDDKFLATTVAGEADYAVSAAKDLLDLLCPRVPTCP
jgi:putative PIN family toxin of toxin-antitoxin system